jgi:hypothetical protein
MIIRQIYANGLVQAACLRGFEGEHTGQQSRGANLLSGARGGSQHLPSNRR